MLNKNVLNVNNLSVSCATDKGEVKLLSEINFSVEKGKLLALVGESGSGKTVTALSLLQLLKNNCRVSGEVYFEGNDILQCSNKEMCKVRGNEISIIFQEPMTALNPLHTIGKQIMEPLFVHKKLSYSQAKERCVELLKQVELDVLVDRLDAYPHMLSGGQRQRVMIAMALANDPKILIADEPTTALDVSVQQKILNLLKKLQKEYGLSILLITHDLTLVSKMADYVCVMHQGSIVEQGQTKKILNKPSHPYTKKLLSSYPSGSLKKIGKDASELLSVENLSVDFPLEKNFFGQPKRFLHAVKNVSLSLKQGETLGVVGESGSGKSTLAMAILRLIQSNGDIAFNNVFLQPLRGDNLRAMRKEMQVVFQDPFASLNPRMTVGEIIGEGLSVHFPSLTREEKENRIKKVLKEVMLDEDMAERYPHEFSGGQRQRIAIARAIILEPKLIIFDEPTSALDITTQSLIISLLKKLQEKHKLSYIFISHDLRVVKAVSHRILILRHGEVIESANTDDIFCEPQTEYTQMLIQAASVDA